jgi:hypothetical protein
MSKDENPAPSQRLVNPVQLYFRDSENDAPLTISSRVHDIATELLMSHTGSDEEIIEYVSRFGGKCRDCADENGVCPHSGAPCDTDQRRVIIAKTIEALRYGIEHRFIPNIFAVRPSPETREVGST